MRVVTFETMGSGLIYVVIVALWAVVLVPMWLNRHDANTETRSVDRFSSAMRSLSRRDNESKKNSLVMPARDGESAPPRVTRRSRRQLRHAQRSAARVSAARAAASRPVSHPVSATAVVRQRQARRKAVVLSVLFVATLAAVVSGAVGVAPMWVIAIPAVLLVGYLWLLRSAAKRASMARARARRRSGAAGARPARAARSGARSASYASARSDQLDTQVVAAGGWEPVPVPLPTYVTAPTATAIPRIIDLTHPGSWTTARMLEQAEYEAAEAAYERRMAAGMSVDGRTAAAPPFFDDDVDLEQVYDREVEDLLKRRAAGD